MKLYRHWVERTCEIAGTTFRFRDGSNVSAAEAEAKIDRRVELLRRTFGRSLTEGESEAVREAMKDIGGRTPEGEYEAAIREEVLEEPEPRNAITRNYYGAEVLNSEDTCFVDVDCVRRPGRGFRAVGRVVPFLVCLAATIAVLRLADRGALQEGPALLLSLAAVFATIVVTAVSIVRAFSVDAFFRNEYEPRDRAEAALLAKIRALAAKPAWRDLALRVYRTAAGFRILVQADGLAPGGSRFRSLAGALDADGLYVDLCRKQGCWRARLTPKPERTGVKRPPRGGHFPRTAEEEEPFAAWLDGYRKASEGFAVCKPVATVGRFVENDVVRLHDERTRCGSDLPLA